MQSIYVGNVSWNTTSEELQKVFEKFGTVNSSRIITDRETGRSRGFAFIEMSKEDADKAVQELNGQEVDGRELRVNLAEDKRTTKPSHTPRNNYNNDYQTTPSFDSFADKPRSKKSWGKSNY